MSWKKDLIKKYFISKEVSDNSDSDVHNREELRDILVTPSQSDAELSDMEWADWDNLVANVEPLNNQTVTEANSVVESKREKLRKLNQKGTGTESAQTLEIKWKKIGNTDKKTFRKFKRDQISAEFNVSHNIGDFVNLFTIENRIDKFFDEFMTQQIASYSPNDLILY